MTGIRRGKVIIGLDFDDTYTQDPALWDSFVYMAQNRGHIVIVATARSPHDADNKSIRESLPGVEIVYSDGGLKRVAFEEQSVPVPDVWIDDSPELIGGGLIYASD